MVNNNNNNLLLGSNIKWENLCKILEEFILHPDVNLDTSIGDEEELLLIRLIEQVILIHSSSAPLEIKKVKLKKKLIHYNRDYFQLLKKLHILLQDQLLENRFDVYLD